MIAVRSAWQQHFAGVGRDLDVDGADREAHLFIVVVASGILPDVEGGVPPPGVAC